MKAMKKSRGRLLSRWTTLWVYRICIAVVFFGTIYSSNIIRLPDTNEGIFSIYQKNMRHATSPYKIFDVESLFDCADACVYDTSCKSINLDKNNDPWSCELVADDRNTKDEYIAAPGVHHYDTGRTALTLITNDYGTGCLVSSQLVCEFTASFVELVVEIDMSICNSHRAALFYYDANLGYLIHHCTGRPVAPTSISTSGYLVIYQSTPPYTPNIHTYWYNTRRDFKDYVFYHTYCWNTYYSSWSQSKGHPVYLNNQCTGGREYRKVFKFKSIPKGPVYVTAITGLSTSNNWNEYVNDGRFPNSPSWYGFQDDMMSGSENWLEGYGMRMEAYFVPPATGIYQFRIFCDDLCMFNMGVTEQNKGTIIDYRVTDRSVNYLSHVRSTQTSGGYSLVQGERRYVELLLREGVGGDHVELTFLNPESGTWCPMTKMYLEQSHF